MASGTTRILAGCAIGCGAVLVVLVIAVIAFVVWVTRPGELLEPVAILDADTTAYAEWTLRLEDPGTERAVRDLLDAMNRMRRAPAALLPGFVIAWSERRDEQKMREMFPLVVAVSLRPGPRPGALDHLVGVSIPRLGNQVLLWDWGLGFLAAPERDLESVEYRGEQIYRARKEGFAFFLRRDGVFVTSDLDTARRGVEAMERPREGSAAEGDLARLLLELPRDRPLRGAALNRDGEIERVLRWLAGAGIEGVDFAPVRSMTLSGGFTAESALELDVALRSDDPQWAEVAGATLAAGLVAGDDSLRVTPEARPDGLLLHVVLDRPVGSLERRLERLQRRAVEAEDEPAQPR